MRIGFDVSQTGRDKAGCGALTDSLIRYLPALMAEDEFLLYATFGDLDWDERWAEETVLPAVVNVRRGFHHTDFEAARAFRRTPPRPHSTARWAIPIQLCRLFIRARERPGLGQSSRGRGRGWTRTRLS